MKPPGIGDRVLVRDIKATGTVTMVRTDSFLKPLAAVVHLDPAGTPGGRWCAARIENLVGLH